MIGVVLAAGKGERLRPFTETRPKPLLPILDEPLILYSLKTLKKLGVDRVAVVVSYMRELIEERVSELCRDLELQCEFVDQGKELGTAHAVSKVVEKVGREDLVVVYGDLYLGENVSETLRKFVQRREPFMAAVRVENVASYGLVETSGERIARIVEKPGSSGSGLVFAGIAMVLRNQLEMLSFVKPSERGEYELTDLAEICYRLGTPFKLAEVPSEDWLDVGYPWTLIELHRKLLSKLRHRVIKGDVEPGTVIKGPIIVEEGAIVKSGTYIEGPAYIGREAQVGPHTYIRPNTAILSQARIGFSVEVKESVVMEHAHASHLAYIGDSVVGEHVNLGAGTILANLRFDNRNVKVTVKGKRIDSGRRKLGGLIGGYVKTGINVSIMPGVKVGSHSIIYPGVVVYRDVPPRTVVKQNWV